VNASARKGSARRGIRTGRIVACVGLLLASAGTFAQILPDLEQEPAAAEGAAPRSMIEADGTATPTDAQIKSRLERIFSTLPGLRAVTVAVSDGVIVLEGVVDDVESRERASELAERVRGSVTVVNRIERDRSIDRRLAAATDRIESQVKDAVGSAPLLLLAIAIITAGLLLARLVGRAGFLFRRLARNWFVQDLIRQVTQIAIALFAVVIALQLLDATALLGSVMGALGILGLAIGFATRDTVENYIASVLLSLRQPFLPHEHISIDGTEGKVLRLTSRATVLMSLDGNHIRIPNSTVYKATIVNFTRSPLRRFEFTVGVDTEIELGEPRDLALETLAALPGVLETPTPQCLVQQLADSSVILSVQGWVDQRESDFLKLRSEAQRAVKEAYDAAGIVMPEPIYNVNLRRRPQPDARKRSDVRRGADKAARLADTAPDRTLDEQIHTERRDTGDRDLLNSSAPTE
jgi:small-conductance mechanosensitive channel